MAFSKHWVLRSDTLVALDHPGVRYPSGELFDTLPIGGEKFYALPLQAAFRPWLDVEDFKIFYSALFVYFRKKGQISLSGKVLRATLAEISNPHGHRARRILERGKTKWVVARKRYGDGLKPNEWVVDEKGIRTYAARIPLRDLVRTEEINGEQFYVWPLALAKTGHDLDAFEHAFEAGLKILEVEHASTLKRGEISLMRQLASFRHARHADGHRAYFVSPGIFGVFAGSAVWR